MVRTLSSRKKGLPCVRAMSTCFRGCSDSAAPTSACNSSSALSGGQGIKPELRVVGLAPPAMLVLGAIVDQQQEAGRRHALDQVIQQGLGLRIDPMQILEDNQQRLLLAFAQQHPLERLEDALAALRRIKRAKRAVLREGL